MRPDVSRLDELALPLSFDELVVASPLPTFMPSWPPPAGHAWVVYLPRDDGQSVALCARTIVTFKELVALFPRALWFSVPR